MPEIAKTIKITLDPAAEAFGEAINTAVTMFEQRLQKRCGVKTTIGKADAQILVTRDDSVKDEGYMIAGSTNALEVRASGARGITAGLGKLLRTSFYYEDGLALSEWRGSSLPTSVLRGIQLDTHFCNYYHMAPAEELEEYVTDLAFRGINCLDIVFPLIDLLGWDDPEVDHITAQIGAICRAAEKIGIGVGLEIVPNQDFVNRRQEFAASPNVEKIRKRGNNGHNMCPNKPGALKYITDTYLHVLKHLAANGIFMEYLCFWPYDEGGCGCEKCLPWGANGFIKASKAIFGEVRKEFPEMKVILSTWLFDTPDDQGEWSGLSRLLDGNNDWVDFILADSHTDYPKYPLTHPIPGGLPLINYPEISMWALYPWGGYGANPLPARFERLWHQVSHVVKGGIAYSEGIFDDINKAVVAGFYWNKDTTAMDTLAEYISYEFGTDRVADVQDVIRAIEENHVKTAVGVEKVVTRDCNTKAVTEEIYQSAQKAWLLTQEVDRTLPEWGKKSWKWRILYLRAMFDELRFRKALEQRDTLQEDSTWTEVLKGDAGAKEGMRELVKIYHSNMDYDDSIHPMYHHVRPALDEI